MQDVEFGFGGLGGEYPGGGYNEDDGPGWQVVAPKQRMRGVRVGRRRRRRVGRPGRQSGYITRLHGIVQILVQNMNGGLYEEQSQYLEK